MSKTIDQIKEELFYKKKNAYAACDNDIIDAGYDFCEGYKSFLDIAKTERESVTEIIRQAKARGYVEFDYTAKYNAGDKVYLNNREKAVILCVFGKNPIQDGVKIAAAHIDSPRLDLKPNPLYENEGIAYFKTHYYGGIRKYQWPTIPLSLHGVAVLRDSSKIEVSIGEEEGEPQFVITDLLPHLGQEQSKRTLADGIRGEELNIVIGSRPFAAGNESDLIKLNILNILNQKYGIVEEDFLSAEFEMVPAAKASDIGFDRSMIGAYGHDDRVCAYPAVMASFDVEAPNHTTVTVLADKEEIGSDGNTGLNSSYLKYFVHQIAEMQGGNGEIALSNSECLSADVNAAFDPTFSDVFEKKNAAFINCGACITKYTGARGKSGSSDASAEFVGKIRSILNNANVVWQTGELGKVDAGGGGTVAMYIANLGVDVVDLGVPVLSMHSPFEVVSKLDVYMCYKAIKAFYEN